MALDVALGPLVSVFGGIVSNATRYDAEDPRNQPDKGYTSLQPVTI